MDGGFKLFIYDRKEERSCSRSSVERRMKSEERRIINSEKCFLESKGNQFKSFLDYARNEHGLAGMISWHILH